MKTKNLYDVLIKEISCILKNSLKEEKPVVNVYSLFNELCKIHKVTIERNTYQDKTQKIGISSDSLGDKCYIFIVTVIMILSKFEKDGMICSYKRLSESDRQKFTSIKYSQKETVLFSGELMDMFLSHVENNLCISPKFPSYVKHNYTTESEARIKCQTRIAAISTFISAGALLADIILSLLL